MGQGTGLGLSTVHGIVQEHGGHIRVYSEEGHGTTFKIYWPSTELTHEKIPTEIKNDTWLLGSESILVVEDETPVRDLIQRVLESHGYRVHCADSPKTAKDFFHNAEPAFDLLVTDIVMPGQSGPVLYTELESLNPGLKVLFISGYPGEAWEDQGILKQDLPFLQKPFTASRLTQKIRDILGKAPAV